MIIQATTVPCSCTLKGQSDTATEATRWCPLKPHLPCSCPCCSLSSARWVSSKRCGPTGSLLGAGTSGPRGRKERLSECFLGRSRLLVLFCATCRLSQMWHLADSAASLFKSQLKQMIRGNCKETAGLRVHKAWIVHLVQEPVARFFSFYSASIRVLGIK